MNTVTASRTGPYGPMVLRHYHNVDRYCIAPSLPISLTAAVKTATNCKQFMGKPLQLIPAILNEHGDRAHPPTGREGRA